MFFEAWSVGMAYRFTSNAPRVLGESAAAADKQTVALDRMTVAMKASQRETGLLIGAQARLRSAVTRTADAIEAAGVKVDAAFRTMRNVGVTSSTQMADATVAAARTVQTSTTTITRRLGAVTASARRASVAMAGVAAATAGMATVTPLAVGGGGGGAPHPHMGPATIAGFASLGVLAAGIIQGGKVQDAAAQTALPLGRSTDSVKAEFMPTAMQMSANTAQSVADSFNLLRVMATSGLNEPRELKALAPTIANFADTQYLGRHHVAFEESTAMAIQIAHQMGARTAGELKPVLNTLYKISQDMPDSLKTAATQLKFFGPQFMNAAGAVTKDKAENERRRAYMREEILMIQATADRMGLGKGRSGTGFRQVYASMLNPSKNQWKAERALHLLDKDGENKFIEKATGRLNWEGFIHHLNSEQHKWALRGDYRYVQGKLQEITTATGGPILNTLSSDNGLRQRAAVEATLRRVKNVDEAQKQLMDTLPNSFKLLITNVTTLTAIIAEPLIKPLGEFIHALADATSRLTFFLVDHPQARNAATAAVVAASAFGAYKLLRMVGGGAHFVAHLAGHHAVRSGGPLTAGIYFNRSTRGGYAARAAARAAAAAGGVGAAGAVARFGGGAVRATGAVMRGAARMAVDMLTFPTLRGAIGRGIPAAARVGGRAAVATAGFFGLGKILSLDGFKLALEAIGPKAFGAKLAIRGVADLLGMAAGFLFKMGLRAIPVVGEILMLIDAIRFLGNHAKDIGSMLGHAAHWIVKHGGPMLVKAFTDVVGFIVNGIKDTFLSLFNGGHGGLIGWMRDVWTGAVKSYKADDASDEHAANNQQKYLASQHAKHHTDGNAHPGVRPLSKKRAGNVVGMLTGGGGGDSLHVHGNLNVQVEGSDTSASASIIRKTKQIISRQLPKGTPTEPGTTQHGVTVGQAVMA